MPDSRCRAQVLFILAFLVYYNFLFRLPIDISIPRSLRAEGYQPLASGKAAAERFYARA